MNGRIIKHTKGQRCARTNGKQTERRIKRQDRITIERQKKTEALMGIVQGEKPRYNQCSHSKWNETNTIYDKLYQVTACVGIQYKKTGNDGRTGTKTWHNIEYKRAQDKLIRKEQKTVIIYKT